MLLGGIKQTEKLAFIFIMIIMVLEKNKVSHKKNVIEMEK